MKYLFAPGCALMAYKPHLAEKLKSVITEIYGPMDDLLSCCFNRPELPADTCVITPCATCAERYTQLYPDCTSTFFLAQLAESDTFPFPDYGGMKMSIQDTCSAKSHPDYLEAVRKLLVRMNITLVEPEKSGRRAKCCGQVFYGKLETCKVEEKMKARADEMPCNDVVVYCASCIMSMTVGGKRPRYLLDLLFNEPTDMTGIGADTWNRTLREFRNSH